MINITWRWGREHLQWAPLSIYQSRPRPGWTEQQSLCLQGVLLLIIPPCGDKKDEIDFAGGQKTFLVPLCSHSKLTICLGLASYLYANFACQWRELFIRVQSEARGGGRGNQLNIQMSELHSDKPGGVGW